MDDDSFDPVTETLDRPPLRVDDSTTPESLEPELRERLEALLAVHNDLKPTLEGWRQLALELALQYEPAFRIETPADRTGKSGLDGRPGKWGNFIQRSLMKKEMRERPGISAREAAKRVARGTPYSEGTLRNSLSRSAPPDVMRLMPYRRKIEKAAKMAAESLSQEPPTSDVTR